MKRSLLLLCCQSFFHFSNAQLQLDITPMGGYPLSLAGGNKSSYGLMAGRLQLSYLPEITPLQPYLAVTISSTDFPLSNKDKLDLRVPVFNTSLSLGLSYLAWRDEFSRPAIMMGGGIGVCALHPEAGTLSLNGNGTALSYNTLTDRAWFPEVELHFRWQRHPWQELGWYFGVSALADVVWMRDHNTRFTTELYGDTYNMNFRNVVLMPMVGGIVGYSF